MVLVFRVMIARSDNVEMPYAPFFSDIASRLQMDITAQKQELVIYTLRIPTETIAELFRMIPENHPEKQRAKKRAWQTLALYLKTVGVPAGMTVVSVQRVPS